MAVDSIDRQHSTSSNYHHADWARRRWLCRILLRTIGFSLLAKIDQVDGQENFPPEGPAILMINHIALIDPIVVLYVARRNIVPLAKIEVYNYPVVGIFPRLWGVIPVRREEFDRRAVQQVLEVLKAGETVLVAPEGTRGNQLSQGKEGVAYIASRSGAPVIPVAIDGTIGFPAFRLSQRWKGPGAHITFGKPFYFRSDVKHPGKEELRKMTDEAMYILATMLPEQRRGYYADLTKATRDTIAPF
jgi:1-acyl-sn-glycerol-3-phosphate acyltransferase